MLYFQRVNLTALLVEALQLALWLSVPVLTACVVTGVLTSLLQGALQAGDPSIGFTPKLFAALGALWLSRDYLAERMLAFAGQVMQAMTQLGT